MKKFHTGLGILTALALSAFSTTAWAGIFDLTYVASTTDDTLASGQLTVANGIATGGFLDITAGPDVGDYNLVAGTGSDSSFIYDDLVFPGNASGFVDSTAGLLWSLSGSAGNSSEVNMWYNPTPQYGAPADTYSLWGAPYNWNLESYGDATLTPTPDGTPHSLPPAAAPDGGPTIFLLGGVLGCLFALRRKLLSTEASLVPAAETQISRS